MNALDFAAMGLPMLHRQAPAVALDYLLSRGHTRKGIAAANFRYLDGQTVAAHFPASTRGSAPTGSRNVCVMDPATGACYRPRWGIALPFADDPTYAIARIDYEIFEPGDAGGPPKFLTPAGRELRLYVPPCVDRAALVNASVPLYVIESPFKAAVAASRGLVAIGVNGHAGAFAADTHRTKLRPELLPYLVTGREVCLVTDADVHSNLEVRRSLLGFMDAAAAVGCKPVHVALPDLGDGKTGIDDFFAAGNKAADFGKLSRHAPDSPIVGELRCAFFDLTEIGLAQRFEAQHGADVRRDPRLDVWYSWTPTGYAAGDVEPEARMLRTVAALDLETAAAKSPEEHKARAAYARTSAKLHTQNAALTLAGRAPTMHIDSTLFDTDPNLLGVKNGILDLRTGKLRAPDREAMVTKSTACRFDPKAAAPAFTQFIDTATNGDKDLRRHIQEVLGAALLGRAMRTQLHVIYGPTATGKSVFIEVGLALLGDYATTSKADLLLRQRRSNDPERPSPFLKTLRGRRLVVCSELNEGVAFDDALIKDLTGGDTVTARGLNEAPVTFKNTATIWVRGNHLPLIGAEAAMRERVIVTPLTHTVEVTARDKTLADRIVATELGGVLNWALGGMRRYVDRGYEFDLPDVVKRTTDQMQRESDIVGLWLADTVKIDMAQTEAPWREEASAFVRSYQDWCAQNGHSQPRSSRSLYAYMRRRYSLDENWPLKSNGKVYATGCQIIRDPASADMVGTYLEVNRALATELAAAKAKLAALEEVAAASDASDAKSSPRVVALATRRK